MVSSTGWWWSESTAVCRDHTEALMILSLTLSFSVHRMSVLKEQRQLITQTSSQTHTLAYRCIVQTLLEGAYPLANHHKQSNLSKAALHSPIQWQFCEELLLSTCTCNRGGGPLCMWKCRTWMSGEINSRALSIMQKHYICIEPAVD